MTYFASSILLYAVWRNSCSTLQNKREIRRAGVYELVFIREYPLRAQRVFVPVISLYVRRVCIPVPRKLIKYWLKSSP